MKRFLAIQGDDERGLEILEVLSNYSHNMGFTLCENPLYCYTVSDDFQIVSVRINSDFCKKEVEVVSLDEFLKRHPYKRGDIVEINSLKGKSIAEIDSMILHNSTEVTYMLITEGCYRIKANRNDIKPYNK